MARDRQSKKADQAAFAKWLKGAFCKHENTLWSGGFENYQECGQRWPLILKG